MGQLEVMQDIEFADGITLFAETEKEMEEVGDMAAEATIECGTYINDKTVLVKWIPSCCVYNFLENVMSFI